MNKYNIYINSAGYKKIHRKLLKYNIKVGGMSLINFLIVNSSIDDLADAPAVRAKRIILHILSDFDSHPGMMENDLDFELNLSFDYNQYFLLRRRLEQLVKEYNKQLKIGARELKECQTVGDCVNLVTSRIYHE